MLRISPRERARGEVVLSLEGRLTRQELEALERACRERRERGDAIVLDLAGLRFLDPAGAALLRALHGQGLCLVGASGYVEQLLVRAQP